MAGDLQNVASGLSNIAENGLSIQNEVQVASGATGIASAVGPNCTTIGRAVTATGIASNTVGLGTSLADIIENGPSAANTFGVFQNTLGLVQHVTAPRCFAAGTPLLTPTGTKLIEEFKEGDEVLSRSHDHPDGPVEAKRVEAVFVRSAAIMEFMLGGRVIKTTPGHPFYMQSRGWMPAGELKSGDLLLDHRGRWHAVQEIRDEVVYTTVYNLRVADYHTYFVGGEDWGFSVWAHNADLYHYTNDKGFKGIVLPQSNLEKRSVRVSITCTEVPHEQAASSFHRLREGCHPQTTPPRQGPHLGPLR